MPDIVKKKKEVKDQILDGPKNVIAARTEVLENVQLGEEMKAALCWAVTSNNLPYWSEQLAKQRAILQGKSFASSGIIKFTFANSTFAGSSSVPGWGSQSASITLPKLEDSSNTSFGVQAFWELDDTIEVTLSGTSGSTQTINDYAYSTYAGDYFFTRSRKDGSIVDVGANNKPYTSPTMMEPFVPANTINGLTYFGTANTPTANTEYRYDYTLVTNATSHGHAGGGKDIGETKYTGNTFVNLTLVNVDGEFTTNEILKDSDDVTSNVKSYTNTTTVDVDLEFVNGTFTLGETVTIGTTNATINTLSATTNTENSIGANNFITGSNTSYDNGFEVSNTVVLGDKAIARTGVIASVSFANGHGLVAGDRVVITGADDGFEEFDGSFDVTDSNTTHFSYETSNSTSVIPVGNFKFIKGLVVGLTSNASGAVVSKTMNNSATVLIQNINSSSNTSDDAGFAIGNIVSGNTSSSTAKVQNRVKDGNWVTIYSENVKTYDSVNGSWNYDSANNPGGLAVEANTADFWLKDNEAVNVASYTAKTQSDGSDVNKIVLSREIATASDPYGGYDNEERTFLPKLYGKLPIKSWADQTSGLTTFLEAYANFATVIVVSEGLEKNANWLALGNNVSGNTSGADLTISGTTGNTDHSSENVTTASASTWLGELGPYSKAKSAGDDIIKSSNPDYRSSGANSSYSNTSTADSMYGGIERNPFYPAVSGTQKAYSNTDNDSTGTQPYGYADEDIYAGQFFQYEGGRKFVSDDGNDIPIDDYSYRFGIWADQKWSLGIDPEQTVILPVSTGTGVPGSGPSLVNGGRTGPPANRFKETFVENTSTLTALSDAGSNFNSGTGGTFTLNTGTYPLAIPASGAPSSPHTFSSDYTASGSVLADPPNNWSQIGASGEGQGLTIYQLASSFSVPAENISGSSASVTYPNIVVSKSYTATASTTAVDGGEGNPSTYTHSYSWVAGAQTYHACAYNEFEKFWRQDGSSSGTSTDAQVTYLDGKLSDLNSNPVDDPFEDGLTSAGNAPIITDAAFDTAVDGLISTIAAAKSAHDSFSPSSGTAGGQSIVTGTYNAHSQFKTYWEDLYVFLNTELPNRIAEITARIGYLDKMPPSSGGDSKLTAKSFANSSSGTQSFATLSSPDSNFRSNPAQTADTGGGWQGYAFKDTNGSGTVRYGGYMSQVFAAANVMAGKKIGFVRKIIDGIDDIDAIYNQITKKRAEFYEYNQA